MKIYRVNEIFYSLQGEGFYTGHAAIFVRFAGCNRACAFCDTDFAASTPMDAAAIVAAASAHEARHVVVTGGEPLLQLDKELVDAFHRAGFFVQIETNGSLPVPEGVDWVTCSPKDAPWTIDRVDELKVVYQGQEVETLLERFAPKVCYLQPCSCANTPQVVEYILRHPHWRLSLQTHKYANFQ